VQNLAFESRWAEGDLDRLRELAAELVRLKVDLIAVGGSNAIRAAQQATSTLPIVMLGTADPVGSGFVVSLARPGGNITGVSTLQADLNRKRLELLNEAVPGLSRVAVLGDTSSTVTHAMVSENRVPVVTEPKMSKCVSHPLYHVPRVPLRPHVVGFP